ncbi:NADH-quinone oxidoreductase subunit C [Streptomyces erythrochromogenes]|uniref:NADH-quinone oxidoreductase subunit C n=1 Tax=Streptomyces erythrochromogenes TaxID=285574 RepID=UPI00381CA2DF
MNLYDSLPDAAPAVFGAEAVAELSYDVLTVDVPVGSWISALEIARDKLGCTYFDWLSAVDEPGTGFRVCAHVASLENHRVRRLLLRTTVPHGAPSLPSAVAVYAGAEWHERETFEMFGITFTDHPHLVHLLLPENFEGHPLRKDFVLAARVAKAWPGAKEPGEAHDPDAPKRRQMLPPGVPDPNDWGPMKGQLPPAPARPARTPRAAGAAGAAARTPREGAPVRRTRSVSEGSATQAAETATPETPARPPRRTRSATEGSASQSADTPGTDTPGTDTPGTDTPGTDAPGTEPAAPAVPATDAPAVGAPEAPARPPRRTRSASDGSASQSADTPATDTPGTEPAAPAADAPGPQPAGTGTEVPEAAPRPARRTRSAADGSASRPAGPAAPDDAAPAAEPPARAPRRPAPRSSDAPWHDPKPAFDKPAPEPAPKTEPGPEPKARPETDPTTDNGGDA